MLKTFPPKGEGLKPKRGNKGILMHFPESGFDIASTLCRMNGITMKEDFEMENQFRALIKVYASLDNAPVRNQETVHRAYAELEDFAKLYTCEFKNWFFPKQRASDLNPQKQDIMPT